MKFTKMQGCGNDYVYVDLFKEKIENPAKLSIAVSDRHFGIGSDGLITIGPSETADFQMHIYNADGSEAEMCGNGVRCVAKYVYDHGLTDQTEITVETGAGIKTLLLTVENKKVSQVRVLRFRREQIWSMISGALSMTKRWQSTRKSMVRPAV